jgi:hypothetical protein
MIIPRHTIKNKGPGISTGIQPMRTGTRRIVRVPSVAGYFGARAPAYSRISKIIKPRCRMDYSTIGGIAGLVSLAIVITEKLVQLINHKRVRSKCCGKVAEASLDVENTTPPSERRLIP